MEWKCEGLIEINFMIVVTLWFCIIFHIGIMCLFVMKFWTFLYSNCPSEESKHFASPGRFSYVLYHSQVLDNFSHNFGLASFLYT